MHIHLATVSKTADVVIDGFKVIEGIEKVYLIHSAEYVDTAMEVSHYLHETNTLVVLIEVDRYDFQNIMDSIAKIKDTEEPTGPHKYTINITGGSKLMEFAALSSAFYLGATAYYITGDDKLPLEERLITIAAASAIKVARSDSKSNVIIDFIYEETQSGSSVTNQDIQRKFGLTKQQVSYYVKTLREAGLITVENGVYDRVRDSINYRYNSIKLTQDGLLKVRFKNRG